jgi:hypothetical protein
MVVPSAIPESQSALVAPNGHSGTNGRRRKHALPATSAAQCACNRLAKVIYFPQTVKNKDCITMRFDKPAVAFAAFLSLQRTSLNCSARRTFAFAMVLAMGMWLLHPPGKGPR